MYLKAYGKINLSLDITGVREDGYHTLRSVFLPVDYYDDVYIDLADEDNFICNQPFLKFNETNTVYKALNLIRDEFGIKDKFSINVVKMIPTQAGLAGGSGDAAAVIRFFNQAYKLNLSDEKIKELAKSAKKTIKEYKETITDDRIGYIKNDILMDKLLTFLVEKNK